ncbi:cytochrome P450 [Streptomyces sp. NPDC093085]|uniref:cytochrome P450 n=1 Tax=Streptomyces sp. NPDC093085 TaxID=3155068 RepID=UPI003429E8E1
MRQSAAKLFGRGFLQDIRITIERTVEDLLDAFEKETLQEGSADFNSLVGEQLPIMTIGGWLQLPSADYPLLRSLVNKQVLTQEFFPQPSDIGNSDNATQRLRDYFGEVVRERRAAPGDDPVSLWIRAWDEMEPDREKADAAVHSLAFFVLEAALETTTHLLNGVTLMLLKRPERYAWLRAHPEQIPNAVEESLRYDAPIHMISRIAPEDLTLGGAPVQAGEMVQLMVGAAHHDERRFEEPQDFDIQRQPTHLAFSSGMHYCLGAPLARMEGVAMLTSLLARMPGLRIAQSPTWAGQVTFRRLTSFRLALD